MRIATAIRSRARLSLLIAAFAPIACSEDAAGPAGPPACAVTSVTVAPSQASVAVGQATGLTAAVASANCPTPPAVTWASASGAVSVQANGTAAQVTGVSVAANVAVTASAGGQSGFALVTVTAPLPTTIVFTTGSGTGRELWRMDPTGANRVQLTNNAFGDYSAALSDDGSKIAFVRDGSLYRMASDGSNVTFVTGATDQVTQPSWSPDGTHIVYCDFVGDFFTGTCPLEIVTSTGAFVRTIGTAGRYQASPDWSPDGASIVYADGSSPLGCCDIRRSPAAGGATQMLLDTTTFAGDPVYSPDGTRIVFRVGFRIAVMAAGGGPITLLTHDSVTAAHPTWSPDGTRIAYEAQMPGQANADIWIMNVDGTNKVNVTNTPAVDEFQPAWGIKVAGALPVRAELNADGVARQGSPGPRSRASTPEARAFDGMLASPAGSRSRRP